VVQFAPEYSIEQHLAGSNALFSLDIPPHIDTLAKQFSSQIKRKGLVSHSLADPAVSTPRQKQKKDIQMVDVSSMDVSWVENDHDNDQYLYVRSHMKAVKESSMNDHFCDRYEEELDNVARAIQKKGGTKLYGKVMERIGRIKERYPTANKHYEIEVKQQNGITTEVTRKQKTW
jgi:hypothetical protein